MTRQATAIGVEQEEEIERLSLLRVEPPRLREVPRLSPSRCHFFLMA